MSQIDFLASQAHYLDHIAPIWDALPSTSRGTFWVPNPLLDHARQQLKHDLCLFGYESNLDTFGMNPILVAGYGDMMHAHAISPERKIIMMEHGIGHSFGTAPYPNGPGKRDWVSLFLPPNQYTADKIRSVRGTPCKVIGTPKLDWVPGAISPQQSPHNPPTIAVGFHHGTPRRPIPEAGSAFEHYRDVLPELNKRYRLLSYSHPLSEAVHRPVYENLGIPHTSDFKRVMLEADVCINDLSSVLYEFLTTGKPVVVLNAPWFRRDRHFGIRFWDYSDVGINVERPEDLFNAVDRTLAEYSTMRLPERMKVIEDLYPYLGCAAGRAVKVLLEHDADEPQ